MTASCDSEQSAHILNIEYGVFLGIIFNFSFYVDTSGTVPTIQPVLSFSKRPEAVIFAVYFILDWFTANMLQRQDVVSSPRHLFVRVSWVAVLGATTVSLNGAGAWKIILLTFYLIVSGIYDFWLMTQLFQTKSNPESVRALLIAATRFCVGATFLIPTLMVILGRADVLNVWDNPNSAKDMMCYLLLLYVLMKAGRFEYLARVEVPSP